MGFTEKTTPRLRGLYVCVANKESCTNPMHPHHTGKSRSTFAPTSPLRNHSLKPLSMWPSLQIFQNLKSVSFGGQRSVPRTSLPLTLPPPAPCAARGPPDTTHASVSGSASLGADVANSTRRITVPFQVARNEFLGKRSWYLHA